MEFMVNQQRNEYNQAERTGHEEVPKSFRISYL